MRRPLLFLLVFGAISISGQTLVCPADPSSAGKPCDAFHYHMQLYSPETKAFTTLSGINQFASIAACEKAREAHTQQNADVVDYVKRVKAQAYEPDRIGPCHCDVTRHASSPAHLSDAQRDTQMRSAELVRRRVRERLLELGVPADSPLLQSAFRRLPVNRMLAGSRLTPLPTPVVAASEYRTADLRMPRTSMSGAPATAVIDLPLVDIQVGEVSMPGTAAATAPEPALVAPGPPTAPAIEETVEPEAAVEFPEEASPGSDPAEAMADIRPESGLLSDPESRSAEDAADRFIRHETQRIQNVVDAVPDASDALGEQVMEACMQRLQALTNLRYLILGAGARSSVAQIAYRSRSDVARLAFVTRLFGEEVASHWMPAITTDVIIPSDPRIDEQPEAVLRDSSGAYSVLQRRRALYSILSRAPITEEQQLWLIPAIEEFLK
ncbi:MAG TPA: hypothetical protein VF701_00555 [Thermoanaerobaculia bacterium]